MTAEKRKQPRVAPQPDEDLPVQIVGGDFVEVGVVQDISEGGMGVCIRSENPPAWAPGTQVDVILVLPGDAPLILRGQVRHVVQPEAGQESFGLQITDIQNDDMQALLRFLTERLRRIEMQH